MKNLILLPVLLFAFIFHTKVFAQNQADAIKYWKTGGNIGLTFSQVSLTNWAAGGENSLSGIGLFRINAIYNKAKISWENYLNLAYGLQKQGNESYQKNEDKIEFISKLGKKLSENWLYTANLNFRTQWNKGYKNPEDSVKFSDFFSPAYITVALGMDFKPNDDFALLLSPVTGKFTFVTDKFLSDQGAFGVTPGETLRSEFGGFIKLLFKKNAIIPNVNMSSNLDLFSNYLDHPERIDVNWEVIIDMKINDYLTANFNTNLIYDYDVKFNEIKNGMEILTSKIQFREALGVGLNLAF